VEPVDVLRTHFPEFQFRDVKVVDRGWDSLVLEIDGDWIFRFPRRLEVERWMEREIALLPELATTLPVAVPRFEFIARDGVACVGYRKLEGSPARADAGESAGADLGRFLLALHSFPVERARALGIPYFDSPAWRDRFRDVCDEFRRRVFPLLDASDRQRADGVFASVSGLDFTPVLVHGDLGPEHVLCRDGRLVGVIDWSDARVGDPGLDLAWCLNGTQPNVARAVESAYRVAPDVRGRSLFYHRLGPWYEVVYGLETGRDRFVASGLRGIRARLPTHRST
jgi:aminoglycoside phosphotransferase (APT) family kinase protein